MENINSNLVGLTDSEVQKRIDEGKVNISTNIKTKSIKRIFCDNIFTLFNLINVILLAALIFVGSHKNMLFIGVVIANIIIGIVQEIRSKISVDKLTILSEKKINVLRNGKIAEISKDEIVLDDISCAFKRKPDSCRLHCMRRQLQSQRKFAYRRIKSH